MCLDMVRMSGLPCCSAVPLKWVEISAAMWDHGCIKVESCCGTAKPLNGKHTCANGGDSIPKETLLPDPQMECYTECYPSPELGPLARTDARSRGTHRVLVHKIAGKYPGLEVSNVKQ